MQILFSSIPVLNNMILLHNSPSRLSVTQASSSFKRLDMRTPMYATPTFITELFHLVTYVGMDLPLMSVIETNLIRVI